MRRVRKIKIPCHIGRRSYNSLILKLFLKIEGCLMGFYVHAALALFAVLATEICSATPLLVVHTNDLHSHLEGSGPDFYFTPEKDGDPVRGHYARLLSKIAEIKQQAEKDGQDFLLIDAGDFYAGTLYHALGPRTWSKDVPELEFFHLAGYDAVNLGNHEFDAEEEGLAKMIEKARNAKFEVPIVASNIQISSESPLASLTTEEVSKSGTQIHHYLLKTLPSGRKVAILGFVGPNAALLSAPNRKHVEFTGFDGKKSKEHLDSFVEDACDQAKKIRTESGVDLVIVTMHGGTPEDEKLASKCDAIGLIVSGHTHESYTKEVNGYVVSQAGSFGTELGKLVLDVQNGKARLMNQDTSVAIDDSVAADKGYLSRIQNYRDELKGGLKTSFAANGAITKFREARTFSSPESPSFGQLIATAIRSALNRKLARTADVYFTVRGLVREGLTPAISGQDTVLQYSDIFRILAIGHGDEHHVGAEVVSFYLTKSDFAKLVEFFNGYALVWRGAEPAFSFNTVVKKRWWGIPFFNRYPVVEIDSVKADEVSAMLKIATNDYTFKYLKRIRDVTHGFINIEPLTAEGDRMGDEPNREGLQEVDLLAESWSEWESIDKYAESLSSSVNLAKCLGPPFATRIWHPI